MRAALKFFGQTEDVDRAVAEIDREDTAVAASATDEDADTDTRSYTLRQLLRASELKRPLLIACTLQVIQQFAGINAVMTTGHF